MTSTTNQEAGLVLVRIGELHSKGTKTDVQSLHAVWASPRDFFQRAINEIETHLQKHLCEYPHWRTWEQKVLRAVSKISTRLTFGYGFQELWNPTSTLCCPSPGAACTTLPHQLHQGPKLVLVQKSVSLKMLRFPFLSSGSQPRPIFDLASPHRAHLLSLQTGVPLKP